jgi:hypothetical protein
VSSTPLPILHRLSTHGVAPDPCRGGAPADGAVGRQPPRRAGRARPGALPDRRYRRRDQRAAAGAHFEHKCAAAVLRAIVVDKGIPSSIYMDRHGSDMR